MFCYVWYLVEHLLSPAAMAETDTSGAPRRRSHQGPVPARHRTSHGWLRRVVGTSGTSTVMDYEGRQVHVSVQEISVDSAALIAAHLDPVVQNRARQLR